MVNDGPLGAGNARVTIRKASRRISSPTLRVPCQLRAYSGRCAVQFWSISKRARRASGTNCYAVSAP